MLTKGSISNPGGGIEDGVASSTIIGGFSSVFASVPGTSGYATATNNNIIADEFLGLAGGFSSSIGDPISTLRPQLNDMELRRRARNNAILAKIQELEANACVQAARSERLRMMRTEYESLVRKYASSGKSRWGTTSNGHLNENNNNNNGFPSSRYLVPFNSPQPQQSSYISLKESDPPPPSLLRLSSATTHMMLTTTTTTAATTNTHPFTSSAHPTRDIPWNINKSFATTGVNTDISGPVKPVVVLVSGDDNANDLQQQVLNLERRKVTAITDSGSNTEVVKLQGEIDNPQQLQQVALQEDDIQRIGLRASSSSVAAVEGLLLPSPSSSVPIIRDDGKTTKANQDSIVMNEDNGDEKEPAVLLLKGRKSVPSRVEMMLMMLDEEDDESSYQEEQARRKQQFENLHQQLSHQQPKSNLQDDTNSISSPPSTSAAEVVSTSNATDEIRFKRQRQQYQQRHMEKVVAEHEKKYQKKAGNPSKDTKMKEETSQDTTTISLANNNINNNNNKRRNKDGNNTDKQVAVALKAADMSEKGMMFHDGDISLSDSTSVFQIRKNEKERKKLLEQLAATSAKNSHMKSERKMDRNGISDHDEEGGDQPEESQSENGSEEIGEEKFGRRSENKRTGGVDDMHSSPTAGATSESIGDSMMDSIHKTPDALLPRDDSELHEIAEVNEKEHVVTATAVSADTKGQPRSGGGGEEGRGGIKELEVHERQINDAEEIRPNNLSSSKVDVPAEDEKNFTHANNPAETNAGGITATAAATTTNSAAITLQEKALVQPNKENVMEDEMKKREKKNPAVAVYKDVEHPMDKEMTVEKNSDEFVDSQFQEKQQIVSSGDTGSTGIKLNEWNKKRGMISHSSAPSANMSAHSSTTSSFTSGSNVVENVGANITLFPSSPPAASTNLPQRHSSSGSSSTSSSRQHSLDDQVDGNETIANGNNISQTKEQSSSGSHHGSPQVKKIQQQQQHHKSPTLPQSVHKRHQQLQQQVRKERDEKETTPPVGADAMPERLSTSSDSFSSNKSPMLEAGTTASPTADTNASMDINNGRKVSSLEKGGVTASVKATKGSPVLGTVPTLTSPPSFSALKKIGNTNQASSSNGNNNISGNGIGGHTTSGTRPGSSSSSAAAAGGKSTAKNPSMTMVKQGQSSPTVTIPSGPTGGQNTARRLKLKLHDDSDTDSSEIGSVKSTPLIKGNLSGNQGNASHGSGHQSHSINNSGSNNKNVDVHDVSDKNNSEKKFTEQVDDDFDDFYDNF